MHSYQMRTLYKSSILTFYLLNFILLKNKYEKQVGAGDDVVDLINFVSDLKHFCCTGYLSLLNYKYLNYKINTYCKLLSSDIIDT